MKYKVGDRVRYVGHLYDIFKGIEVTISHVGIYSKQVPDIVALLLEGMAYYECSFTYKGLLRMLAFHEDDLEPLIDQNEVV